MTRVPVAGVPNERRFCACWGGGGTARCSLSSPRKLVIYRFVIPSAARFGRSRGTCRFFVALRRWLRARGRSHTKPAPNGAKELSPARKRWVKWKIIRVPSGTALLSHTAARRVAHPFPRKFYGHCLGRLLNRGAPPLSPSFGDRVGTFWTIWRLFTRGTIPIRSRLRPVHSDSISTTPSTPVR